MSQSGKPKISPNDLVHVTDFPKELNIFRTKAPKDIWDGTADCATNLCIGTLGGAIILVAAPIAGVCMGASENGFVGGLAGLGVGIGVGVVGSIGCVTTGVCYALSQLVIGLISTPSSISSFCAGKEWDEHNECWTTYNLKRDVERILNRSEGDAEGTGEKSVADMEFYKVLGVSCDATPSQIKKAYYTKARENHPDRCLNDPEAHSRFQKIGEAYQILSDERLRFVYDQNGKAGVEGQARFDPAQYFQMIFGSERFIPIIGELQLMSRLQDLTQENGKTVDPRASSLRQKKREVKCAITLAAKLDEFKGDENIESFREKVREEASDLVESSFGAALLEYIGEIYIERARGELNVLSYAASEIHNSFGSFVISCNVASAAFFGCTDAIKLSMLQSNAEKRRASGVQMSPRQLERESEQMSKKIKDVSANVITIVWYLARIDIKSTLAKACKKVTHDKSVTPEQLYLRKWALLVVGEEYAGMASKSAAKLTDFIERMDGVIPRDPGAFPGSGFPGSDQRAEQAQEEPASPQIPIMSITEITELSVRELKEQLVQRGCDLSSCVEKLDMQRLLCSKVVENMSLDELKSAIFDLKTNKPHINDQSVDEFFVSLSEVTEKEALVTKLLFTYLR